MERILWIQLKSKVIHDLPTVKWKVCNSILGGNIAYHITQLSSRYQGWWFFTKLSVARLFAAKSEIAFFFGERASNRELDIFFWAPIVLCHVFVHDQCDGVLLWWVKSIHSAGRFAMLPTMSIRPWWSHYPLAPPCGNTKLSMQLIREIRPRGLSLPSKVIGTIRHYI